MTKLILLDRDGVINIDSPEYIKSPSEWHAIPGSLDAIAKLRNAGYLVAICSNQSGVARGKLSDADLDAVHEKMLAALARAGGDLNAAYYCRHHPSHDCECRKPKPGMLRAAMQELQAPPQQTLFVGDTVSDVQAALAASCRPVLVRTGKGATAEQQAVALTELPVFEDLAEFAEKLLS